MDPIHDTSLHMLGIPWVRFSISGTLLLIYGLVDHLGRRRPPRSPAPRWHRPVLAVALTAFYVMIGPTGGVLLGGWGNLAGGIIALLAVVLRLGGRVRYPALAGRSLLSLGLPLAVGVPWGLGVLTLPTIAAGVHGCRQADRARVATDRTAGSAEPDRSYRMLPGVW